MDSGSETDVDEANNVLLVAPSGSESADDVCRSHLNTESSGEWHVAVAMSTQSPDDRVRFLETHPGNSVTAVLAVDGTARGADSAARDGSEMADALGFGVELTRWLSHRVPADRVHGCVHTLSDLLRRTGDARPAEWLAPILERTARFDASVHYHLDPTAHDDDVVAQIGPWFDAVVKVRPDGSRTVRTNDPWPTPDTAPGDRVGYPGGTLIDIDTVFDLLSDRRRRALLYALRTRAPGESVSMDALVDHLLETDGRERPTDRRDRLVADLSHRHLPRLADAGLVDVAGDSVVRNAWGAPLSRWTDRAMRMELSRRATDPDGSSDPEP